MTPLRDKFDALLRSTPLRLSIALVALFALVSLTSLGASFLIIRDSLDQTMRIDLQQDLAGFQAAPSANAVAQLITAEAAMTNPERRILSFTTADGRHFGNGFISPAGNGFRVMSLPEEEDLSEADYLTLSASLHDGRLTVSSSRAQIEDLGELFINILVLSLLPTTAIALAAGLVISRRSGRRIEAIGQTLEQLTQGNLAARVPKIAGRSDDLSMIAGQIDRMAGAQQSSVDALKQVSADIAHDLKTPIQRVSVLLSKAREMPALRADLVDVLDKAGQETDGIVATFQSLLQIAQIEGGSPKNRFKPVDLRALAATFAEVYEPAADERGHKLIADLPKEGTYVVSGEKGLLGQVLANLMENALRHTPAGSDITLSVGRSGEWIEVSVCDTGPGIPAEERRNVLRRLYRLEQSRTTPGNGLGLSLVAAIVEMHEGKLALEDNNPGLCVKIRFQSAETR